MRAKIEHTAAQLVRVQSLALPWLASRDSNSQLAPLKKRQVEVRSDAAAAMQATCSLLLAALVALPLGESDKRCTYPQHWRDAWRDARRGSKAVR